MALADLAVKSAKPKDNTYKISDAGGLYLFVTLAGGKLWRLAYRFEGKQKTLTLGAYPDVSLASVRDLDRAVSGCRRYGVKSD